MRYLIKSNIVSEYNWPVPGLIFGDWGLGIGDWVLGTIPNPQSPIPNPQLRLNDKDIVLLKYFKCRYQNQQLSLSIVEYIANNKLFINK